jgi:hypothetical protein
MSNPPIRATRWRLARCVALCGAFLAAGCGTVANPASCADGFCHDPAFPFCDVDGTIGGGSRLTCIAVDCTPHEFTACRGDEAIVCNATGDDHDVTHCEGGCSAEAGGCKPTHIIPKYLPTVCDQPAAAPALTISESTTLDTGDDASCNGGIVDQVHGPDICVLRYGQITLERNKTLTVTGSRALALVADQALTIDGILDVSANGLENGPGGGFFKVNLAPQESYAGYGGAGFRTKGGAGGNSMTDGGASNGGTASIDPALLVELTGGPQDTHFALMATLPAGAGGAATAISCRDTVSVFGMLDAGGGGGYGGRFALFSNDVESPRGGGAGGNVALQGMRVTVTGYVFANGGGGGAGKPSLGMQGRDGADGIRSDAEPAQGGASQNDGEGAGGNGGTGSSPPGPGNRRTSSIAGAGAGGGSTGFFQTYTPAGITPTLTPVAASPPFQPNRTVEMR